MKVRTVKCGYWMNFLVPEEVLDSVMSSLAECYDEKGSPLEFEVSKVNELSKVTEDYYAARLKRSEEDLQREKDHAKV